MGRAADHKGKRIGFLVVIEPLLQRDPWGAILWKCKCDCGGENILNSGEIKRKAVISCSMNCPVKVESNKIRHFKKNYVIAKNDCWIWTGYRDKNGYGSVSNGRGKSGIRAHRFSYELFKGEISQGLYVLHKCDNPSCVNPDHLFLGTPKENYEDSKNKGRNTRGEKQKKSKIKDVDVIEIRKLYSTGEKTFADISKMYGISRTTAHRIVKKMIWKHIE